MATYKDVDKIHKEIDAFQTSLMSNDDKVWRKNKPYYSGAAIARGIINDAPTVDVVEVKHGKWIDNHCSVCGMTPIGEELWTHLDINPPRFEYCMDFCPCCGAKMDGGAK